MITASALVPPTPTSAQAVLLRNEQWLREVVEQFSLCPFAKTCRTSGKLHREVLNGPVTDTRLHAALLRLQQTPDDDFEVGLILAPRASADPRRFEQQVRRVADAVERGLKDTGRAASCHAVAFHPQMPFSEQTPAGLTGLWRRSPHPTVQLVRKSVLDSLRGRHTPLRYVDVQQVGDLQAWLAEHHAEARAGLSARIAEANAHTWHASRAPLLEALLRATGGH